MSSDNMNIILYSSIGICVLIIIGVFFLYKKQKDENNTLTNQSKDLTQQLAAANNMIGKLTTSDNTLTQQHLNDQNTINNLTTQLNSCQSALSVCNKSTSNMATEYATAQTTISNLQTQLNTCNNNSSAVAAAAKDAQIAQLQTQLKTCQDQQPVLNKTITILINLYIIINMFCYSLVLTNDNTISSDKKIAITNDLKTIDININRYIRTQFPSSEEIDQIMLSIQNNMLNMLTASGVSSNLQSNYNNIYLLNPKSDFKGSGWMSLFDLTSKTLTSLVSTTSDLNICTTNLTKTNSDLTTCQTNYSSCNTNLSHWSSPMYYVNSSGQYITISSLPFYVTNATQINFSIDTNVGLIGILNNSVTTPYTVVSINSTQAYNDSKNTFTGLVYMSVKPTYIKPYGGNGIFNSGYCMYPTSTTTWSSGLNCTGISGVTVGPPGKGIGAHAIIKTSAGSSYYIANFSTGLFLYADPYNNTVSWNPLNINDSSYTWVIIGSGDGTTSFQSGNSSAHPNMCIKYSNGISTCGSGNMLVNSTNGNSFVFSIDGANWTSSPSL